MRAAHGLDPEDRYWPETLASLLSGSGGIDGAAAFLVALAVVREVAIKEMGACMREVNVSTPDPFLGRVISGIQAAAPEFGRRMVEGRVDSDEVFLRAALAHFFRRDPGRVADMFVIDAAARQLSKALKVSVGTVVREVLEDFEAVPVPERAWGYLVVLREMSSRAGYFLYPPRDEARAILDRIVNDTRQVMSGADEEAGIGAACASAYVSSLKQNRLGEFAALMSAVAERKGHPFLVMYVREGEGPDGGEGVHTYLSRIPASTPEEARRLVASLPDVRLHDEFRALLETIQEARDLEEARPGH